MSKSFEIDQNLYAKCVIYIQVHSGDVKCYSFDFLKYYRFTVLIIFLKYFRPT